MKLTLLICLFFALQSIAKVSLSQNQRLSIIKDNIKIEDVIQLIEKNTDYYFMYSSRNVDLERTINIEAKNKLVPEILDDIFKGTNVSYKIDGRLIAISKNGEESSVGQQSHSISGKVTDSSGNPLPGVSVVVKGTTNGTITNSEGFYTLSNVSTNATLVFSFVGMKSQEIKVDEKSTINLTMEEETVGIDEVVAIGYGTQKKSDLTGSVSSIRAKEIVKVPALTAIEAVQGKIAGLSVINAGGTPGSFPKIRIRGGTSINASSDPLIVVDGFAGASMPTNEDIASMEVLKDASATAIYGSQGANGVILITTKKGTANKVKIEFAGSQSMDLISNPVKVLNGSELAQFINEVYGRPFYDNPSSYGDGTNWFDLITRNGSKSNYNIALSGGNEKLNYYASGRYYDQEGIVGKSGYKNYSMRTRLDFMPIKKLHITASMQMDRGVNCNRSSDFQIVYALKFNPTQGVYNPDGTYTVQSIGDVIDNPYAYTFEPTNERVSQGTTINTSVEYEIIPGLKVKSLLGFMADNNRFGSYTPTTLIGGKNNGGVAFMSSGASVNLLNENYLNYNFKIKDFHEFNFMSGFSYQKNKGEYMETGSKNFITDSGLWWNLGGGSAYSTPGSGVSEWTIASWYGRLNYSFRDKYKLTVTGRYDGSSRFGANNKWAFFPSGALAWNVKKEPFMEDVRFIDQFKIRTSYGETGNTSIPVYSTLARFGSILTAVDNAIANGVTPTSMANADLTWESTKQVDAGVDLSFWNGLLRINTDYYKKTTDNLLYSVPVVRYSGYSSITKNYGSIENKGFELTLGSDFNIQKLKWEVDLNISTNKNKVLDLPGGDVKYSNIPGHLVNSDPTQIIQVGKPLGSFYGYIFDGLYQQNDKIIEPGKEPGDVKYRDLSGDGQIDANDRTIIGTPYPKFTLGLSNSLKYKVFDLSFMFMGVFGNDVYNLTAMELDGLYGKSNTSANILNRWTPQNTNTNVPRANGVHNIQSSTRWVEDGSYIRLKDLSLGYNLPKHLTSRIGADGIRISFSGQNLLTITNYSGFDPEVSSNFDNKNAGLDYDSYPNIKSYTLGINVSF